MRKIVTIILCMLMLFGCSSNDSQNDKQPSNSDQSTVSYSLDDVTKELIGKWQSHNMHWTIEISEDGTYIWYLDGEEKQQMDVAYDVYLNSFDEYQAAIQHDPEFSNAYGVHIINVKDRGDMLVGQGEDGNYKFYFWGQKWSRIEE